MKEITPKNVHDFAQYMSKEYDIQIIGKGGKLGRAARFLIRRIKNKKLKMVEFLTRVSFALPGKVKLSFDPGDSDNEDVLLKQIATICHEFTHAAIQWRDNKFLFILGYFFSAKKRAWFEARAKHANLEVYYAFGDGMSIRNIVVNMGVYKLGAEEISTIYKHLELLLPMVKSGNYSNPIVKDALKWWEVSE